MEYVRDLLPSQSYADPRNSEIAMDAAPDRYRYILSRPVDAPPGTRFTYSGGDVALLGEVIARATGEPLADYARRRLFAPLGIDRFEWLKDAKGIPIAASGLRLRPRDMAAIGQMMLENGRWRGRQIVPATWIREVIAQHAQVQPNAQCGTEYGYLWWLTAICLGQDRKPLFFASGNGGQDIWVAPSEHLVVVTTAGMYNTFAGDSASGEVVQTLLNARDAASH